MAQGADREWAGCAHCGQRTQALASYPGRCHPEQHDRRDVCELVKPPRVEAVEIEILAPDQIADVLAKLEGHALHPIVSLALATGMRRGELLSLQWGDVEGY